MTARQRVLVLGGHGRLGRRLCPRLVEAGWEVLAPPHAELDVGVRMAQRDALFAVLGAFRPALVLSLAGYTDVPGCETNPDRAEAGNVQAAHASADLCAMQRTPFCWVSTDYVLAGSCCPAPPSLSPLAFGRIRLAGGGVYAESKASGESWVTKCGGVVARVAFACPEDTERWRWVDGYGMASREWVGRTAERLTLLAGLVARREVVAGTVLHVGPLPAEASPLGLWRTHRDLLAARYPSHPALQRVAYSPAERAAYGGNAAPGDTRFAECDARLELTTRDDGRRDDGRSL